MVLGSFFSRGFQKDLFELFLGVFELEKVVQEDFVGGQLPLFNLRCGEVVEQEPRSPVLTGFSYLVADDGLFFFSV